MEDLWVRQEEAHTDFSEMCVFAVFEGKLVPEFCIWICLWFLSPSRAISVISAGSPVPHGLFWSTELQGAPTCSCWTQSRAAGRGLAAPVPWLVQHHCPRTHAWFVTDILNLSSKLECLIVGRYSQKTQTFLSYLYRIGYGPALKTAAWVFFPSISRPPRLRWRKSLVG